MTSTRREVTAPNVRVTTIALRGVWARKIRLTLTVISIAFGVAFYTGASSVSTSLNATFEELFGQLGERVDLQIRGTTTYGDSISVQRPTIDVAVGDALDGIDGIDVAQPNVFRPIVALDNNGDAIETLGGAPSALIAHSDDELGAATLREGRAPQGTNEAVVDVDTAVIVGDTITIRTAGGTVTLDVVGTIAQRGSDGFLGAVIVGVDPAVADQIAGTPGQVDLISVRVQDGADPEQVAAAIAANIGDPGVEVVPSEQVVDEQLEAVGTFLGPFGNILRGFALIALFVAGFIITNTFAMSVTQRLRELAMLRAIGATSGQIARIVMYEAAAVGIIASALGIAGGVVIARGIIALFSAAGGGFPDTTLTLETTTVVVAVAAGIGITLAAALKPARRAANTPPLAALGSLHVTENPTAARKASSALTAVGGFAILAWALLAAPGDGTFTAAAAAAGAIALFASIGGVIAHTVKPAASALVAPLKGRIVPQLAARNVARSPQRAASAASALVVGLTLVSAVAVIGASVSATLTDTLRTQITATHIASAGNGQPLPAGYDQAARNTGNLDDVTALGVSDLSINASVRSVTWSNIANLEAVANVDVTAGNLADAATAGTVAVVADTAEANNLDVGDNVEVIYPDGTEDTWTVAAIVADTFITGDSWMVDATTMQAALGQQPDTELLLANADDTEAAAAAAMLADEFGSDLLVDTATFEAQTIEQIDALLSIVYALLGLALAVAMIGIANTLALSVLERTREIGLLRAIGALRQQVKRSIRIEAVFIVALGALSGTVLGAAIGLLGTQALDEQITGTVAIPVGQLTIIVAVAIAAGVAAAWWPARRASKLDILAAIADD